MILSFKIYLKLKLFLMNYCVMPTRPPTKYPYNYQAKLQEIGKI